MPHKLTAFNSTTRKWIAVHTIDGHKMYTYIQPCKHQSFDDQCTHSFGYTFDPNKHALNNFKDHENWTDEEYKSTLGQRKYNTIDITKDGAITAYSITYHTSCKHGYYTPCEHGYYKPRTLISPKCLASISPQYISFQASTVEPVDQTKHSKLQSLFACFRK